MATLLGRETCGRCGVVRVLSVLISVLLGQIEIPYVFKMLTIDTQHNEMCQ